MANKYLHVALRPGAGVETELLEVPAANTAVLRSLRVTNNGSATSLISVTQYDSGSVTATYLLKARSLTASATFDVFNGIPCVMEAGDIIKVTSSAAGCHFYLSYLEMDRN